jgi:hypothetical protein
MEAARLMARGMLHIPDPDEEPVEDVIATAAAAFGLVVEAGIDQEDEFHLWPENVKTLRLWLGMQTQWWTDAEGGSGLRYEGVLAGMRMLGIPRKEQRELFLGLQAMERATLDARADRR